jgi:hypothetical protein
MTMPPNRALQRIRPSLFGCNRGVPRTGSLSLGRYVAAGGNAEDDTPLQVLFVIKSPKLDQPLFLTLCPS